MSRKLDPEVFNIVNPVCQATIYKGGLVLKRRSLLQSLPPPPKRGDVKSFSRSSWSRLAFLATNTETKFKSMLTLTYPIHFPIDGRVWKNHLDKVKTYLFRKFGHYEYLWFLEFQARGAPHFHVLLTYDEPGPERRLMLAKYWVLVQGLQDWPYSRLSDHKLFHVKQSALSVASHHTTWEAFKKPDGGRRYAVKYALKAYQKTPPTWLKNVGRFWGKSSGVHLPAPLRIVDVSEAEVREWMTEEGRKVAEWPILPKLIISFRD